MEKMTHSEKQGYARHLMDDNSGGELEKETRGIGKLTNLNVEPCENGYMVHHTLEHKSAHKDGEEPAIAGNSDSHKQVFTHPDDVRDHIHKIMMKHHEHHVERK